MSTTSTMSSSPPQLSLDILHLIAQKMLFTKPDNKSCGHPEIIDLRRQNGFTSFMAVNPTTRNVFLNQFMKMKHIEFGRWDPHIKMFKEKKKGWGSSSADKGNAFSGPYLVTKKFVGFLIDFGKMNVSSLKIDHHFDANIVSANKKPCNFAIQSFCKLLLNKEISDEEASNIHFELDELDLWEENNVLTSIFDELLNLDAKEVKVTLFDWKLFDFSLFSRTIMAKRTQKFGLTLHYCSAYGAPPDELKLNWQENINFLLSICPEIRQIESTIFYDIQLNDCIKDFVIHLGEMVDMLVKQVFPNLSEGNPTAQINVLLEVNFNTNQYEELLNNGHKLLKKGHEIEVSELDYVEAYIARKCQITDKSDRIHRCEFRILAHEVSYGSSDAIQQDSEDEHEANDYDYDNNYHDLDG